MNLTLLLHEHTKNHVAQFNDQPMHAVMLVGPGGIGKTYLAEHLIASVLGETPDRLAGYPYFRHLSPDKGSISIESIRELQHFLQLKAIGQQPLRRAVLIEHADALTVEAQNAFLKLLEEPPADTLLVMTVNNQRALLPTILSRVQSITVYPPDEQALREYFIQQGKEAAAINQAYFLSGGLPGLMTALLSGDENHPLLGGVATAKMVLQKPLFERLVLVDGLSKQKPEAVYMLQALQHIAQTGLAQATRQANPAKLKRWHHILKASTAALDALEVNVSPKLVLSNLMFTL